MTARISWFEVMGQDQARLQAFYAETFGWTLSPQPTPHGPYAFTECEQTGIPGGVGQAPAGQGWSVFYVEVDSLEQTIAAVVARGGSVLMPAASIPSGRIAVLADPEGHPFGISEMAKAQEA